MTTGGYETSDARASVLVRMGLGLAALVLASLAAVRLALPTSESLSARPHPLAGERPAPPGPELQVGSSEDLERLRARDRERLATYGWVDREAGIARIPIERALELLLERGLPARPAPEVGR